MSEQPAFQSKTYYDVVFGTSKYQGWRNIYAGDGALVFRHESGEEAKFEGGNGSGWIERAWRKFIAMVESREGA